MVLLPSLLILGNQLRRNSSGLAEFIGPTCIIRRSINIHHRTSAASELHIAEMLTDEIGIGAFRLVRDQLWLRRPTETFHPKLRCLSVLGTNNRWRALPRVLASI